MIVNRLSVESYEAWDSFVSRSPQGSIFSTASYLTANKRDFFVHAIEEGGEIVAGMVMARDQLRGFGNPLFANYLGPILPPCPKGMKPQNHTRRCVKLLIALAETTKDVSTFDYTFHPEMRNWLPYYWQGFQCSVRYSYRIKTDVDMEQISGYVQKKLFNLIRKSEKSDVTIDTEIVPAEFYKVGQQSFQRQGGSAPYSLEWLNSLHKSLAPREQLTLLGARNANGELLAVAGLLHDNRYSYFLLNGYDHNSNNSVANSYLLWKAIEYSRDSKLNFDFEGSMLPGVESFYRKFGGELTPYYRVWKPTLYNTAKRLGVRCYKTFKWGK